MPPSGFGISVSLNILVRIGRDHKMPFTASAHRELAPSIATCGNGFASRLSRRSDNCDLQVQAGTDRNCAHCFWLCKTPEWWHRHWSGSQYHICRSQQAVGLEQSAASASSTAASHQQYGGGHILQGPGYPLYREHSRLSISERVRNSSLRVSAVGSSSSRRLAVETPPVC